MSRVTLEDNQTRRQHHNSPSYGNIDQTLTGDYVVKSDGPTIHFFDAGASDRTVRMPARRAGGGQFYMFKNFGAANALNLVDDLGGALCSVLPGEVAFVYSSMQRWASAVSGTSAAPGDADYLVRTSNATLSAERVVTDTTSVVWDWTTAGQAKATRAALTGDVTAAANSNATTVAKINGVALGSTAATSANLLIADGSQWVTRALSGEGTITNLGAFSLSRTFSPTMTGNWTFSPTTGDALTINPAAATMAKGLTITQTSATSGSISTSFATFNRIAVNDQINNTIATFANGAPENWTSGLLMQYTTQGTNTANFHAGIMGQFLVPAATSSPTGYGLVGIGYINGNNSRAGAGVGGINGYAIVDGSGVIGVIEGIEAEVGIRAGGTATYRAGVMIDNIGAAQATALDAAIMVTNFIGWNGSTDGGAFKNLVAFSQGVAGVLGTGKPLDPTGNFFVSDATFTVTSFAALSNVTFTGDIFNFGSVFRTQGSNGWTTIGRNDAPDAALTINLNNGTPVAPVVTAVIHTVAADGTINLIEMDSYASSSIFGGRRANGTRAAKTVVVANDVLFVMAGLGWDGTNYGTGPSISVIASETFSGTAHGSRLSFFTVPLTTITNTESMRLSSGLSVGNANIATDPGAGGILATLLNTTGAITIQNGTAIPAGGTAGVGYKLSSTSNFGIFFGSGAPSLSAAKGSIYLRSDGSSIATRLYVNTDGSTTWTNVATAA